MLDMYITFVVNTQYLRTISRLEYPYVKVGILNCSMSPYSALQRCEDNQGHIIIIIYSFLEFT
jgi:hypothetical protein